MRIHTAEELYSQWGTKPHLELGNASEPFVYDNAFVVPMNMYQSVCYDSSGDVIVPSIIMRGSKGEGPKPQFQSAAKVDPRSQVPYHDGTPECQKRVEYSIDFNKRTWR